MKDASFPGSLLKERREALGLTVHAVSRKIHVPLQSIEAFESGVFTNMPGRAYALGFLRSYCRFLDFEPEAFSDQYLLCTQTPKGGRFMRRGQDEKTLVRAYPRWLNEVINWGSVCVIIVITWVAYTTVIQPVVESWKSRAEAGSVEIEVPIHFNEDL